jgi:stage II sporulation protein D
MSRVWRRLVVVAVGLSAGCASGGLREPHADTASPVTHVRVRLGDASLRRVPLEDYVRASILSEVAPASGDPTITRRMLEVQAIIARSYAAANTGRHRSEGYDLCSTTHCQLYEPSRMKTSSWARAAAEATAATAGVILRYGPAPATTVFHADCGGHTSAAHEIWRGPALGYLPAAADDGAAATAHSAWRYVADVARLRSALNSDTRSRVGAVLSAIVILQRDRGGRAALVSLQGSHEPLVRGEELRLILNRSFGPRAIRSTAFTVRRAADSFVFEGRGFGHGVGLCQAGALARLKAGASPQQVLARYYPGTRLGRLR